MKTGDLRRIKKNTTELSGLLRKINPTIASVSEEPLEIWVSELFREDTAFRDFLITLTWKDGSQKSFHVEDRLFQEKKRFPELRGNMTLAEIYDLN